MAIRTKVISLVSAALIAASTAPMSAIAQERTVVPEPPIPVFFENSARPDSLSGGQEGLILTNASSLNFILQRYDSLQGQIQKSTAQGTVHFIWLYSLVAVLGAMNIILLFFVSRMRKELSDVKRLEHRQALTGSQSPGEESVRRIRKSSAKPSPAVPKKKRSQAWQ